MDAHELVRSVHESFPNMPKRLSKIMGKCEDLIRSHAREPKTRNPLQSGNVSPVTHYLEYCYQYEAALPGAGKALNDRVHASLNADFNDCQQEETQLQVNILDETCDVHKWLAQFDIATASPNQLIAFERECSEAAQAIADAHAKARAARRVKETKGSLAPKVVQMNGTEAA